jgi:hypothetical protein
MRRKRGQKSSDFSGYDRPFTYPRKLNWATKFYEILENWYDAFAESNDEETSEFKFDLFQDAIYIVKELAVRDARLCTKIELIYLENDGKPDGWKVIFRWKANG